MPCWLRRVLVTSEKDSKGLRSERSLPLAAPPPWCCCWCKTTSCCCCCCDWLQAWWGPEAEQCCCWIEVGCCCCCCTGGQQDPPWRHCCWKGRDSVQRPIHRSSSSFETLTLKLSRAKLKTLYQKFALWGKKKQNNMQHCSNFFKK